MCVYIVGKDMVFEFHKKASFVVKPILHKPEGITRDQFMTFYIIMPVSCKLLKLQAQWLKQFGKESSNKVFNSHHTKFQTERARITDTRDITKMTSQIYQRHNMI